MREKVYMLRGIIQKENLKTRWVILPAKPFKLICIMCTKLISRVKEAAKSERVKNVVKTTLKVTAVIGGAIIVYKFGKSMGKTEGHLKLQDALCEKAWDKYGRHVGIDLPDGSRLDLQDALSGVEVKDIVGLVEPRDVLETAKRVGARL
jgi:hypothetical protein